MQHDFSSVLLENEVYLDALQRPGIPVMELGFEELKYKCGHKLAKNSPKAIVPKSDQLEFLDRLDYTMKFLHHELAETPNRRSGSYMNSIGGVGGVAIDFQKLFPAKTTKKKPRSASGRRPESPRCARPTDRMVQIEEEAKRLSEQKEREARHLKRITQDYDIIEDGVKYVYSYHGCKVPVDKLQPFKRKDASPDPPSQVHRDGVFRGAIIEKTGRYVENLRHLTDLAKPKAKQTRPTSAAVTKPPTAKATTPPKPLLKTWPEYQLMEEDDVMITIEHNQNTQNAMAANDIQQHLTDMMKAYAVRYYCLFKITASNAAPKPRPSSAGIQGRKSDTKATTAPTAELFEIQFAVRGKRSPNIMVYLLHSKHVSGKWPVVASLVPQVKKLLQESGMLLLSGEADPMSYTTVAISGVQKIVQLSNTTKPTLSYELYPIFDYRKPPSPTPIPPVLPIAPVTYKPDILQAIIPPTTPPNILHLQFVPNPVTVDEFAVGFPATPQTTATNNQNKPTASPNTLPLVEAFGKQPLPPLISTPTPVIAAVPAPVPAPTPATAPATAAVSATLPAIVPAIVPATAVPPIHTPPAFKENPPVITTLHTPRLDPIPTSPPVIDATSAALPTTESKPVEETSAVGTADNLALAYQQLLGNSSDEEEDSDDLIGQAKPSTSSAVMMLGGQESQAFGDESLHEPVPEPPLPQVDEPKHSVPVHEPVKKEEASKPTVTFAPSPTAIRPTTPPPTQPLPTATTATATTVAANDDEEEEEEEFYDVDFDPISPMNSPERKPIVVTKPVVNTAASATTTTEPAAPVADTTGDSERRPSQLLVHGQYDEVKKAVLDIKNMLHDDDDDDNDDDDPTLQQSGAGNDDEFWDKFDRNLAGSFYDTSTSPSKT